MILIEGPGEEYRRMKRKSSVKRKKKKKASSMTLEVMGEEGDGKRGDPTGPQAL